MATKIKAKVLKYQPIDWEIFCGVATLKLREGVNKGQTIEIYTTEKYRKWQIVEIYETKK